MFIWAHWVSYMKYTSFSETPRCLGVHGCKPAVAGRAAQQISWHVRCKVKPSCLSFSFRAHSRCSFHPDQFLRKHQATPPVIWYFALENHRTTYTMVGLPVRKVLELMAPGDSSPRGPGMVPGSPRYGPRAPGSPRPCSRSPLSPHWTHLHVLATSHWTAVPLYHPWLRWPRCLASMKHADWKLLLQKMS